MKLKPLVIEILKTLLEENKYISLSILIKKLDKFKPSPRNLQKELKKLIETNRVIVQGQASRTEYAISDIVSNYYLCNKR